MSVVWRCNQRAGLNGGKGKGQVGGRLTGIEMNSICREIDGGWRVWVDDGCEGGDLDVM